ncbi:MAG: insulinase family protein [Bdellovibrionales bacterium]|nr:insulinase family protein [Bdellovibrionales bacterium]
MTISRKIQRFVLPSGMTVLFEPMTDVQTVSLDGWIKAGSAHEQRGEAGVAHFLEHMLFTASNQKSNVELLEAMQQVGGYANAFTTYDHTGFECVVPAKYGQKVFEWFEEIVLEPVFDEKQIEREKKVILSEFLDDQDQLDIVFEERFWKEVYGTTSFGRPILGLYEDIQNISKQSVTSFYEKFYHPKNMVISIAGNVEKDHVSKFLQKIGKLSSKYIASETPKLQFESKNFVWSKGQHQRKIVVLFPITHASHEDVAALEVFNLCLGGADYSFLYEKYRTKKNYVSHISSHLFTNALGGHMSIEASVYKDNIDIMLQELTKLSDSALTEIVTEDRFECAVSDIEKEKLFSMDTTWGRSKINLYFEATYENVHEQNAYYEKIKNITKKEVVQVAQKYFQGYFSIGLWKEEDA